MRPSVKAGTGMRASSEHVSPFHAASQTHLELTTLQIPFKLQSSSLWHARATVARKVKMRVPWHNDESINEAAEHLSTHANVIASLVLWSGAVHGMYR